MKERRNCYREMRNKVGHDRCVMSKMENMEKMARTQKIVQKVSYTVEHGRHNE